jgi:hypothetical protein
LSSIVPTKLFAVNRSRSTIFVQLASDAKLKLALPSCIAYTVGIATTADMAPP